MLGYVYTIRPLTMLFECTDIIGKRVSFTADPDDNATLYDVVNGMYSSNIEYDQLIVLHSGKDARKIKMRDLSDRDHVAVRILYSFHVTDVVVLNANASDIIANIHLDENKTFMELFAEQRPDIANDNLIFMFHGNEIDANKIMSIMAGSSTIQLRMHRKA